MLPTGSLAAFAVTSALLIAVPGPSVLFVISRGVTLGRRAALLTVLGNEAGILVQVALVAAGLGAVLQRSALLFDTVRLAGAAYLVYLGVQAIRERRALSTVLDVTEMRPPRHILREGFIVGVSNPKLVIFFTAVLPQFVDPGGGPVALQLLVLGGVFTLIALVLDSCWGVAAGTARAWLSGAPHRLERLGGAGGLVIMGLGLDLAITGRKN